MGMTMARASAGGRGRGQARLAGRFDLKQNSDINVTPFVDVMLVLLIVMMVTAPLATVAVNMNLPQANKNATQTRPTFISITEHGLVLTAAGAARPTSLDALGADLARTLGPASAHPQVMLRADRHVRYGAFMEVVNALKGAGYDRIGLISESTE